MIDYHIHNTYHFRVVGAHKEKQNKIKRQPSHNLDSSFLIKANMDDEFWAMFIVICHTAHEKTHTHTYNNINPQTCQFSSCCYYKKKKGK